MLLLYCANGAVVATHNDTDAAVPASAYPGARIVPYNQPIETLEKVGPPPPDMSAYPGVLPPPDVRPYAQPTETPAILIDYAAQVRFDSVTAGISFNAASGTIPAKSDRTSQTLLSNLALYAQSVDPATAIDFTQDGVHYAITAQEAIDMYNAVYAHVEACRSIEAQCIADLNSTSPTILTYDDVDTRFEGVKAKTLKGVKKAA
jgi:hypothetical protein